MTAPVVTIDGPSGAGKGTVGQQLAIKLNWHYLDSGALYRVIALLGLRQDCLDNISELTSMASSLVLRCEPGHDGISRIWVGEEDVSEALRDEQVSQAASKVAIIAPVRAALLALQRSFQKMPGLVADGRDMGSTVFPSAPVKIYLTASPQARTQRRYKQLKDKGLDVSLSELQQAIDERDKRDMARDSSPLLQLEDAIVIDTSELSMSESLAAVEQAVRQAL